MLFRLDDDLLEAMRQLKDDKGIPVSVQIDLASRAWLKSEYGITVKKAERKRAVTRKRS